MPSILTARLSDEIVPKENDNINNAIQINFLNYALEKAILSNISKIDYEELMNINIDNQCYENYFVAYGKICYNSDLDYDVSNSEFFKNLSNFFTPKDNVKQAMMMVENHLIYLYNLNFSTHNHRKEKEEIIEILKRNIKQYFDLEMYFGVSSTGGQLLDIPMLVDEGKKACGRCFFSESKMIHYHKDFEKIQEVSVKIRPDIIRGYIDDGEMDKLYAYIDDRFDKIYSTYNKIGVRKLFIDFISLAKIIHHGKHSEEEMVNEAKFRYLYFDKLADFNAIKVYVKDVYDFIASTNEEAYSYCINKSIQYIKENYERNISLEEVAEYSQISKSYLSLLFKQETGINFSNFLTNYRVEKCKKYMQESHYKIYEIAEKVGFENPYYFSKVFKEKVGISCKEYQKKYSKVR
ncbi:MAG: AraC family transcriptional regulator [Clostridia bacterium]|nr:AraC family transcriptional regulator [Clostridia bacterium]